MTAGESTVTGNRPKPLVKRHCQEIQYLRAVMPVCTHICAQMPVCPACHLYKIKLSSASMLSGGNHATNLPICPQQPWLIEYVRGDESNQKTAESQSWG